MVFIRCFSFDDNHACDIHDHDDCGANEDAFDESDDFLVDFGDVVVDDDGHEDKVVDDVCVDNPDDDIEQTVRCR